LDVCWRGNILSHIDYSTKIFIDRAFLEFLKKLPAKQSRVKFDSAQFLSIIKTSSSYTNEQNLILREDFEYLFENEVYKEQELKFMCTPSQEYLDIPTNEDRISRIVKNAIFLTDNKPFKVTILTSTEDKLAYSKILSISEMKDIRVLAGTDACSFIYEIFRNEYESNK
jgi:hypothetical protein